jgi:hypothetical protein
MPLAYSEKNQKLLSKFDLNVSFILNVFSTCCILHNMFRSQIDASIQRLMKIIKKQDVQVDLDGEMPYIFNVDPEENAIQRIMGQERSNDAMHRELCIFLR